MRLQPLRWTKDFWRSGKTWGLRLYVTGLDPGILFTIQRKDVLRPHNPIGPLRPVFHPPPRVTLSPPGKPEGYTEGYGSTSPPGGPEGPSLTIPEAPLRSGVLGTLDAMFSFLNKTSPNITQDCWLCLNPEPPYYTGVRANLTTGDKGSLIRNVSLNVSRESLCKWGENPKLTLDDLQGQGTCVYPANYPLTTSPFSQSCASHVILPSSTHKAVGELSRLLVAPGGTWWACTNGLTPCVFPMSLIDRTNPGLRILTHILPQVYYYSGEGGREHLGLEPKRQRRAPVLVPLLLSLGLAGATAVGSAALVKGNEDYKKLSKPIDIDLSTLKDTVGKLETSLSSLAEVVLRNRRGLDLLFLKQGGLCLPIGETCCFYTNHSGVIRESLSQLRRRLQEREEERARQENCYKNLFS